MEPKKGGRTPLTPEQKEERRLLQIARANEYHKKTGWAAQKRYRETHKGVKYEAKVRIPAESKDALIKLLQRENKSLSQMLVFLINDKYGIDLSRPLDTNNKK